MKPFGGVCVYVHVCACMCALCICLHVYVHVCVYTFTKADRLVPGCGANLILSGQKLQATPQLWVLWRLCNLGCCTLERS